MCRKLMFSIFVVSLLGLINSTVDAAITISSTEIWDGVIMHVEVPIDAVYSNEQSNLNHWRALIQFPLLHIRNFFSRLVYSYFLRNFSIASLNLVFGSFLCLFGIIFGLTTWIRNAYNNVVTTSGTVMISALPFILGFQLLTGFLSFDISNVPDISVHNRLLLSTQLKKQPSNGKIKE